MRAKFPSSAVDDSGRRASAGRAPDLLWSTRRIAFGRKLWVAIHRTLGLSLGALFVLIGLSGSILAFWQPIDEWLNADIMRVVRAQADYRPLDEIFATARSAAPPLSMPERLRMPRHPGVAAGFTFLAPTDDAMTEVYEIFVDPYTAKVTGQRLASHGDQLLSQPFIHILMDFHWTLLLGYDRAYLVGAAGICLLASILAGLYLWWPRNGNWTGALTVKWRATPGRLIYDIHRSVGLYFGVVLIVSLTTGISMIFKPQTRSLTALFSPVRQQPQNLKSTPIPGQAPLGLEAVTAIAANVFPDGRLHWILFPGGPKGSYVVGESADAEPNRASTNRNVTIDQYSGQILHVQDRATFGAGERLLEWLYPLHCGEAFGNAGRALIMVAGVAPLVLFVTGLSRWRYKRRARITHSNSARE